MGKSTLRRYEIPGNILVVYVADTSPETVEEWYTSSVVEMDGYTGPVKRMYDMRDLKSVSIGAVRTAVKVRRHRNASLVYTAVLTSNSTVASLVKASLSVNAGGNIKLFTDQATAEAWLNASLP